MSFVKSYYKVIIWCLMIFILSSIPSAQIHTDSFLDFILRKSAHIIEFFVLFLFAVNSFDNKSSKKNLFLAALFSLIYAFSDEYHQSFVKGRGPSIRDVGIDSIGIALGVIYFKLLWSKTPQIIRNIFA